MATRYRDMTGETEWYTPEDVLEAVREVFGGQIDLDPASSAAANERVKAVRFFDREQNGLQTPWSGNCFVNPPYHRSAIREWAHCATDEFLGPLDPNIIWLSNASVETAWAQEILRHARRVCFPAKRMKFSLGGLPPAKPAMQGQMIALLSTEQRMIEDFEFKFNRFGPVFGRRFS